MAEPPFKQRCLFSSEESNSSADLLPSMSSGSNRKCINFLFYGKRLQNNY